MYGEMRKANKILDRKPEGKGREETTWNTLAYMEDNTELDLRKIGWEGVNWIHLAQNRDQ
jgi:hypothetical protein